MLKQYELIDFLFTESYQKHYFYFHENGLHVFQKIEDELHI